MQGYIYSDPDLDQARRFLVPFIKACDPDWLNAPSGAMARRWNNDASPGVLAVIDIAHTVYNLQRNMTARSAAILPIKVAQLLWSPEEEAFEEQLTELQVGALFGALAKPIELEPMVPEELIGTPRQPAGIDYAITLPGGHVGIEVTSLRLGILDRWDKALEDLKARIGSAINKGGLLKDVEISVPLGIRAEEIVRADQLSNAKLHQLAKALRERDSGTMTLKAGDLEVAVTWQPLPHYREPPGSRPPPPPGPGSRGAVRSGGGAQILSAAGFRTVPVIDPEKLEGAIIKSIRGTVDGKKHQIRQARQMPVLLVFENQQHRVKDEYILHLIQDRLWPNKSYQWLSGLGIYSGKRTFQVNERAPRMAVSWNPSARHPPTEAFRALIEAGAVYADGVRTNAPSAEEQSGGTQSA